MSLVNFNGHYTSGDQGLVESTTFAEGWHNNKIQRSINSATRLRAEFGDRLPAKGLLESLGNCSVCGEYLVLVEEGDHYEVETRVKTGEREYAIVGKLPVFEYQRIPCKYPDGLSLLKLKSLFLLGNWPSSIISQ